MPKTSEANYVTITGRQAGCYSYVGLIYNGSQELNLQPGIPGCLVNSPGIAEHEMLHALGTWHEQSRPDRLEDRLRLKANELSNIHSFRDQYVTVNEVNVQADKLHNFDKKNPSAVLLNGAYDYSSVMHYSRCAFSKNNLETITVLVRYPIIIKISLVVINLYNPSQDSSATIGQRSGMTQLDVNKLMSFYGC